MTGYLINFLVYTCAMVGIIFAAMFIYKKTMCMQTSRSEFLGVEDSISLAPRKTLYVVRAGAERFLVASDVDKTNLIAKLGGELPSPLPLSQRERVEALNECSEFRDSGEGATPFKRIMSRI